jgi:hypothetical protein
MARPPSFYGIIAGALLMLGGLWQGVRVWRSFLMMIAILGPEAAADPASGKLIRAEMMPGVLLGVGMLLCGAILTTYYASRFSREHGKIPPPLDESDRERFDY